MSSLHQHIPAEELPEEVGGMQGPMDNTFLVEQLKRNEEYFKGRIRGCNGGDRAGEVRWEGLWWGAGRGQRLQVEGQRVEVCR